MATLPGDLYSVCSFSGTFFTVFSNDTFTVRLGQKVCWGRPRWDWSVARSSGTPVQCAGKLRCTSMDAAQADHLLGRG